ncbi:MAG: hypothetical protein CMP47_06550 [Rickettsiales bacterium]|nr:hypothetical protein [Rickettsiales bacterium]
MLKRAKSNEFARNVVTLITGTAVAQAIPVAISPILTRLYSPEDFGVLALFIAITSIISVFATLRFEIAIPQAKHSRDAAAVTALSLLLCTSISLFLLIIVSLLGHEIAAFFNEQSIANWLYLTPLSVWLFGSYQALNYWFVRKKKFKDISKSKVLQSTTGATVQCGSFSIINGIGLILGQLANQAIGLIFLIRKMTPLDKMRILKSKKNHIKRNASKYQKLPKYSAIGSLADKGSLQMPILVIGKAFDLGSAGLFSLTFRVLNLPMSLVSTSISQVLFQKVNFLSWNEPHKVKTYILKLFALLLGLMVPFILIVNIYAEDAFALVFGEAWRKSGEMGAYLVWAIAIRFAVSPLSTVLALEKNIKIGVLWQIIYFFTITTTLIVAAMHGLDALIISFVVHEVILYGLYFLLILSGASRLRVSK